MTDLPKTFDVYEANATFKAEALKLLHHVMCMRLRQPALGLYLSGVDNRTTRRAIGAMKRSVYAKLAMYQAALIARRALKAKYSDSVPPVVD